MHTSPRSLIVVTAALVAVVGLAQTLPSQVETPAYAQPVVRSDITAKADPASALRLESEATLNDNIAAAFAPGSDLASLWISASTATRNLALMLSTMPPGWLLAGALPGFVPSTDDHPDLRPLTTEPVAKSESSGYGWRDDPVRRRIRKFHKGTDYRAKRGTPVLAAGAGEVVIAKSQNGYGNVVYLDHGGGLTTRYGHMSKIDAKLGQKVQAGEILGRVGATGKATGPHLHFEIRISGRAVDPVLAMKVAELQRTSPDEARIAEAGLAPELQSAKLDRHDPTNLSRRSREKRPERRGRAPRERALW